MGRAALLIFLLIPLITRMFFYFDGKKIYENGDRFKLSYRILHEPRKNDSSQYFFIDDVMVSMPLYPSFSYGDTISIDGKVEVVNGKKGEIKIVKNPKIEKTNDHNLFFGLTKFIRDRVTETFLTVLPEREAGLILGIILGVRDKINSEFYEKLRLAGVLHVVAASGQNVSIVASLVLISLQKIVKRRLALLFTGVAIILYASLSGFDPPIVRASIMGIVTFSAFALGRQASALIALLITSWGMLLFDPSLLTNTSFHLSVLSTWGILSIKPILDGTVHIKKLWIVRDDFTTTISAQLATIPIILLAFGTYSLIGIPVNLFVLWTVPILMIGGGIAALLSLVMPFFSVIILYLLYPLLLFFTLIVDTFSKFDMTVQTGFMPEVSVVGYYLILFGIVYGVQKNRRKKS